MREQFRKDNQDVAAENTLILNALKDEELQLTEDRATLSAEEFAAAAVHLTRKCRKFAVQGLKKFDRWTSNLRG